MSKRAKASPEQLSVCAFIDILGFSEAMLSTDEARRTSLIEFLRGIAEKNTAHGPYAESLGGGALVFTPSAEASSFSDNLVISFPLKTVHTHVRIGLENKTLPTEPAMFMNDLLTQIISSVWSGLQLGVLFRGGITVGSLVHTGNVVAGEALVRAVELEKFTSLPRIEICREVIGLTDENGNPLIDPYIFDCSIREDEGRYFVDTTNFHMGVWRDFFFLRNQSGFTNEDIFCEVEAIRQKIQTEVKRLEDIEHHRAAEKWNWFYEQFQHSLESELWQNVIKAKP